MVQLYRGEEVDAATIAGRARATLERVVLCSPIAGLDRDSACCGHMSNELASGPIFREQTQPLGSSSLQNKFSRKRLFLDCKVSGMSILPGWMCE